MGAEISKRRTILLSVVIFSVFFITFVVIAVIEPQDLRFPKEQEIAVTVSAPQKIQETSSGQIAGVSEGPTVINISNVNNSRNETE